MDIELEPSEAESYRSLSSGQVSRLQLLYLFPRNYEFHRDEVIQLWIAHDLVPLPPSVDMEFCARSYFKEFEEHGVFQLSTLDYSVGQQRYKLSNSFVDLLAQNHEDGFFRIDDLNSRISENTKHASLRDDSIDAVTLDELYKAERLATLLIIHLRGNHLDQLPHDLFLNLPLLRVLDLSHTSLAELPSFIGNLNDLRYLNLSYTPITALPKSLCSLYKMQTLKLKGCLKLVDLPKGMRKLINLRHLEVDLDCLLVSMPLGLGDLVELRTLPAFVVGKENGCHIAELRNMKNLCGTLSILRLQNVSSSVEAEESALENKIHLQTVELHWTDCVDGLEVLENLQPHTELEELQIVGYGGAKFPNWIGEPNFSKLATITICDCRNCEMLPPVGKLPSLQRLSISDMQAVKTINSSFCGKNMTAGLLGFQTLILQHFRRDNHHMFKAFQSLEKLTFNRLPMLETWSGIEEGDFPNLRKLYISHCPKLTSLPELSLLISLQQLEISLCPLLESFPNKGLPTSLQCLVIIDCPRLKVLSHKDERKDLGELGRIPNVWIDYQQIIQASPSPTTGNSALPSQNFEPNVRVLSDSDMEKDNRAGVDSIIMIKPHGSPGKRLASSSPTGRSSLPNQNVKPKVRVLSDTDREKGNRAGADSLIIVEPHGGPEKKLASPSQTIGNSPLPSQSFKPNVPMLLGTDMEKENRAGVDSIIMIKPHGSPGKRLKKVVSELSSPQTREDGDLLVNKDGIQIVSSSEEEASPHIKPTEGHFNPKDLKVIIVIEKGSCGLVQLVLHKWTNQFLAHKAIPVNLQKYLVKKIAWELNLNQSGQCPYVAVCYQSFYAKGILSLILEYMDGGSLADFLKKVNSIPEQYLAAICKQVLKGFLYLHHEKHIIHRDMKPSNLLINHRGEVKITDFGVNAALATTSAEQNTFVGTGSYYMSPERITGSKHSYSYESDIWSLGIVLLECATGRFPYRVPKQGGQWYSYFEFMDALINGPPPYASADEFSPEFCSFIFACLRKDPKHRQTAQQLMEHRFISMYDDMDVDLAAYFTSAGSLLAIDKQVIKRRGEKVRGWRRKEDEKKKR